MPTIEVNGVEFTYSEVKFGTNRGIRINADGEDATTYQIRPNPHDNRKYNKDQPRFYLDLAEAIGTHANANAGVLPPDGTVFEIFGVDYTVERR